MLREPGKASLQGRRAGIVPSEWRHPPRVIGHRGSPREAPENTLASFAAAAKHARAVELDARLSSDGVVVVHHDRELGRVLPGTERVEDLTAAELRARGAPTLREVLALDPALLVNVELKSDMDDASGLPGAAREAVERAGARERALVTSFDWELADRYARLAGDDAGAIVPFAPEPGELASFPRLRYVALAEDAALAEVLRPLAKERVVLVWTVNDERSARRVLEEGAAGVITDRPGPLARSLGEGATVR